MITRSHIGARPKTTLKIASVLAALLALLSPLLRAQDTALTVTGTLPAANVGQNYLQALQASGSVGSVAFTTSGDLPAGMFWAPSGTAMVLDGTPGAAGSFPLSVTASDSVGQRASWSGTLTVMVRPRAADNNPPSPTVYLNEVSAVVDLLTVTIGLSVSPNTVPIGTAGTAYPSVTFTSPGGGNAVNFTESGTLPNGMSVTTGGNTMTLSGTPFDAGTYPFTINVADNAGHTGSQGYLLYINAAPAIAISVTGTPSASVVNGGSYGPVFFSGSGGAGNVTLSESGGLPTGVNITFNSGTLEIYGYPTQLGTFPFSIGAIDSGGHSVTQAYTLIVTTPPPVTVYPATILSSLNVGAAYPNTNFYISGGSGYGSVALTGGSLPQGMGFNCVVSVCPGSIGVLSGTPTSPGTYTFTITATDAHIANSTASQSYTIHVVLPHYDITPGSFATAASGVHYAQGFSIVGNPAGYTLTMTNAAGLPAGLTYAASGETVLVSGTPPSVSAFTSYGPFSFNLTDQYRNVETLGPTALGLEPAPVATIAPTVSPAQLLPTNPAILTFALTGNYSSPPTGTIIATVDGQSPLYLSLVNSTASINLGTLSSGMHTVVYSYSGDSVYPGTGSTLPGAPAVNTLVYTFTVYTASATLTPASFTFPGVTATQISFIALRNFTFTNTGTAPLSNTVNVTGANASAFVAQSTSSCNSLAAGASCTVSLLFEPQTQGSFNATLIITSVFGSAVLTQTSSLNGTGLPPPTLSAIPNPVRFPATVLNATATAISVTLSNSGTGNLQLNGTSLGTLGGADSANFAFAGSSCGYSFLSNGSTCAVSFTFTPNAARTFNATYTIRTNDPASPMVIPLTGVGVTEPASTAPYVFVVNAAGSVSSLASDGSASQSSAVAGGGIGAAVDRNDTVFSLTADGTGFSSVSPSGTLLTTTTGILTGAAALAIDGNDQLWIAAPGSISLQQILSQGAISLSDPTLLKPSGIAIDISGNVWIADSQSNTVHEVIGGGAPVLPLANAVQTSTLGVKP